MSPLVLTLARSPRLVPKSTLNPPAPTSSFGEPTERLTWKIVGDFTPVASAEPIALRSAIVTVVPPPIPLRPFSAAVMSEPADNPLVRSRRCGGDVSG